VLIGLALVPVFAHARAPSPRVLRDAGVRVSWPLKGYRATLVPGTRLRVAVTPLRRGSAAAQISLVRLDDGAPGVVKQRTLRRGVFTARLPKAGGARYALRLRVGKRAYRGVIRTPPPPKRPDEPGVSLPAPATPSAPCPWPAPVTAKLSAALRLDRATAYKGETVGITIENTGEACLRTGAAYQWERLVDGSWQPIPEPVPFIMIAYIVPPGRTLTRSVTVHADDMPAGEYRLIIEVDREGVIRVPPLPPRYEPELRLYAPLTVLDGPPR
jgi:hypothetical protein